MITKEYRKKWRETHRDHIRKYDYEWRKRNPQKAKAIWKRYHKNGKYKILQRKRAHLHYVKHKEEYRFRKRQRDCRVRNAEGSHTLKEWEDLKKKYNYTCPMCGRKEPEIKLTEDHIIPLFLGGSNFIRNIQPLCRSCNSIKSIKVGEEMCFSSE